MSAQSANLKQYLDIHPDVAAALADGQPVVALESTIISHGMPYPQNVETALKVEQTVRENGALPATIAIINGRLKVGLSEEEITYLGKTGKAVIKNQPSGYSVHRCPATGWRHHRCFYDDHCRHGRRPGICNRRYRRGPPGR